MLVHSEHRTGIGKENMKKVKEKKKMEKEKAKKKRGGNKGLDVSVSACVAVHYIKR